MPTKAIKPPTAAAPAAPDVPVVWGGMIGGFGGGGGYQADAAFGKDVVRARAQITVAAVVRNIPFVVLRRLMTERLTTNDFMLASPKNFSRNYFCGESVRRGRQRRTAKKSSPRFLCGIETLFLFQNWIAASKLTKPTRGSCTLARR